MAQLGLGTYRVKPSAVRRMVDVAGDNPDTAWVDTAPGYLDGEAHALLKNALARPEISVSTKVGYVGGEAAAAAQKDGVLTAFPAAAGHCLEADFVRWQVDRSRVEMGRDHLELVFVHNPESNHRDPYDALRSAFEALEEQATAGHITAYGVATWSGFDGGLFTVPELNDLATEVAGTRDHHCRAIQLPVSLVMATPIEQALNGQGPIADAELLGWEVYASSPFHGGELPKIVTPELRDLIDRRLSPAEASVLVSGSCPGVSRVLLSTSSVTHWYEARTALKQTLTASTLERVLGVLASD
ncbi:aldo/keto reductase [Streptomyces sp. NPDC006798]|uniref:aldo/keto reductase n=1 Tax=Streptomyces sp. NPDC006798 TaxID=3155462 RepID=UPI0034056558